MNISTDRCNIHYTQPKIHWCNGFVIYIKQILTLFFLNLLIFSFNAVGQLSTNNNADKWIAFNLNSILYNGQHAGVAHAEITNHVPNEWNTIQTGTLVSNSNVQFTLDAMNPIRSLVFNTKFAPPEAADLDQLRNGGIGEPPTPNNWVNGNAGPENSHFIESWSIPYRMRISGLTNNTSHNIIIEWDIMGSSGTKHAIDYITHFQNLGSNTLHSSLFGHNAEVVNPGFGLTVSSTNTWPIPAPSSAGSPVAGQPTTSFNALNLKDFTIYNGTITAMSYVSQGDLTADGSKTRLSITFTANFSGGANTVILGWGGHIASQSDWGIGESASDINGSPYHTRLIELDGSGGNQDRSLKADAVVVPPGCNITSPDLCPLTTSSTATAGLTNAAGVTTSYTWSLTGTNTANATLTGSTSGSVASGVTTIPGVGISAPAGGFAAGTSFTVQLSVSRTFSGIVFSSICTKTVNITTGATATATANPTVIDIRTAAHNTTLNVSVTPGNISDYDLLWTEDGAGSLNFNNVASPVYTAVPADQAQTINFNVTLTPKAGTTGLCPNNAQVSVPVNGTATCLVSCLTNCSPCAGSVSTFRGPLNDPVGSNTFYDWNITSGDASITGADNGQEVTVTAGLTNYRLELTITYSNTALNQAPCGIDVTVGDVQANAVPTHALCFGGNGSVNLTVSGGTAPYTFLWNTGATTEDLASVPAGAYSVTVTDANGCTETANATVNQPTDVTANAVPTHALCFGGNGSVNLTVGGGTPPYTFLWNTGATTEDLASVPAGAYSVTVTDANGCTETANATVNQPTDVTANAVPTHALCFGGNGSVNLTVGGGTPPYTFLWNTGATTEDLASVPAGAYSVTVTDANGCTETANATVNQPTDVTANAVPTHALCFGGNGSVNLTVGGGTPPYTFLWNTGATTEDLASVPAGAYSVTVTDANGCTETANATVNQPTDVTANAVPTPAACNASNGSVNLTVGGGTPPYTFLWNTGATTEDLASVPAGAYSVTVTDANGCTETANATVNQPTDVTANAVPTHALCFGGNGSVNLTVGGGTPPYTFLWNTGATTEDLASVPAGAYSVTVTDANGCTETANATVNQPTDVTANAVPTHALCFGGNGSVNLTVGGGTPPYTFLWNTGATTEDLASVPAGAYSVTVTDANGCTETANATVNQPNALSCSLTTPSIPVCGTSGSTVSGTVSGGTGPYTCSAVFDATGVNAGWSVTNCAVVGGVITVTYTSGGVASTVLTVTVTDANGCTSTCTVTLTCDGGKGCTPGFWKTHPEMWDNCSDLVVQAIPGASCTGTGTSGNFTPGADFTTSTPFVAYFGITNNTCGGGCRIANLPSTMGAAMSAGGGDCKKLARTGVAALLNAAVFGSDYLDATGYASYTELYNAIKNGFNTCTYEPLATNLDRANNQDHSLCSGLPGTILTSSIVSGSRINNNDVTLNVSKQLTVQAYPNPFNSEINFRFISPESGYANLEVFDMVGRKLSIVYAGHVDANVQRTVTYRVPVSQQVPMVYRLTVNGKAVVGKLLPGDRNNNY